MCPILVSAYRKPRNHLCRNMSGLQVLNNRNLQTCKENAPRALGRSGSQYSLVENAYPNQSKWSKSQLLELTIYPWRFQECTWVGSLSSRYELRLVTSKYSQRCSNWVGEHDGFENFLLHPHGGFLKWWYQTTIGFPTKNDHFGVFWGFHHLRKHHMLPCIPFQPALASMLQPPPGGQKPSFFSPVAILFLQGGAPTSYKWR